MAIGEAAEPAEVVATWRRDFGSFWPEGSRFYGPITGLEPGEVALLNLTMPGGLELSTGVLVLYADDEGFTLMTPEGHQFAGWITFSAFARPGTGPTAQAEVLMRSSDPIYEIGMAFGAPSHRGPVLGGDAHRPRGEPRRGGAGGRGSHGSAWTSAASGGASGTSGTTRRCARGSTGSATLGRRRRRSRADGRGRHGAAPPRGRGGGGAAPRTPPRR